MVGLRETVEVGGRRYDDVVQGLNAYIAYVAHTKIDAFEIVKAELREFLEGVALALERRHGTAWPGGTGPNTLSMRSGGLVASIAKSIEITGTTFGDLTASIGADFPAQVHEYGATIRARNAKFLTIPLPAALDNRGIPLKASARDWEHTFVARSKMGNLIIFQKNGAQITPLYVLKTEVTIPPRLGLRDTLAKGLPYYIDQMADRVAQAVNAGKESA